MPGPGDQGTPAAVGRGRQRVSRMDREQAIELLKVAFVQDRLTQDELGTRVGLALASRTYAELTGAHRRHPRRTGHGRFLPPWLGDAEGDPPHAIAVLVYLTTLTYLLVLAMTLWLGGPVLVGSWLKRRSGRARPRRASS